MVPTGTSLAEVEAGGLDGSQDPWGWDREGGRSAAGCQMSQRRRGRCKIYLNCLSIDSTYLQKTCRHAYSISLGVLGTIVLITWI